MIRHFSKALMVAGIALLSGIYFYSSAGAAEPAAKPAKAVKAPAVKPAEQAKAPADAEKPAAGPAAEPSVQLVPGAKGVAKVELQNDVPVRALQFAVTEAKITEVRTTDRTKGFLAKFNDKNGKVIILSTAGDEIAPGKGAVAEIVCDKPASAKLVDGKIVWNR